MLYPFLIAAVLAILAGIGSAIIGYDLKRGERVDTLKQYLWNWLECALYVATGIGIIALYVFLFGWPSPE